LSDGEQNQELIDDQRSQLAETLNDLANVSRKYGNMGEARQYCKASLLIRESLNQQVQIGHCCYVMGMIMWEIGNTSESIAYLHRARKQYQAEGVDHFENAWIDRYEGYVMYRIGNFEEARTMLLRSLDATRSSQSFQDDYAEVLLILSRINRDDENFELSLQQAETALQIATQIHNEYRHTEALLTLSLTMLSIEGADSSTFKNYFHQGKKKASTLKYRRLEVIFADIEASLAFESKDYDRAFEKYIFSCSLALDFKYAVYARQLSNLSAKLQRLALEEPVRAGGICNQLVHDWKSTYDVDGTHLDFIAEIEYINKIAEKNGLLQEYEEEYKNYFLLGKWEAISDLLDTVENHDLHLTPSRAKAYLKRAELSYAQGYYSEARLYCERAQRIGAEIDPKSNFLADCNGMLGRIYWKLGNTAEANDALIAAQALYEENEYLLGVGQVESIRAYIYFRTQRYEAAYNKSSLAIEIFEDYNQTIALSRAYNMLSRMARTNPAKRESGEKSFLEAERFALKAERVLGGQSKYVQSEINLTLGILYFLWGQWLNKKEKDSGRNKIEAAIDRLMQSWEISDALDISILASVYHGIMGNIKTYKNQLDEAIQYYAREMAFGISTKERRLLWSINLFENWLMEQPLPLATKSYEKFVREWNKDSLGEKTHEVTEILDWFIEYQKYIRPQDKIA
jgi:tetratricopeptide (TPR) repeat protein